MCFSKKNTSVLTADIFYFVLHIGFAGLDVIILDTLCFQFKVCIARVLRDTSVRYYVLHHCVRNGDLSDWLKYLCVENGLNEESG